MVVTIASPITRAGLAVREPITHALPFVTLFLPKAITLIGPSFEPEQHFSVNVLRAILLHLEQYFEHRID